MDRIFLHALLLTLLSLLLGVAAEAQVQIGVALGGSTYEGDLAPDKLSDNLAGAQFSYGMFLRYKPIPLVGFRAYYHHSSIQGDDALRENTQYRNLTFASDINEVGLFIEVYPLYKRYRINPYFFGGGSMYAFSPTAIYNGEEVELQPLGTEGQGLDDYPERYKLTRFAVPIGAGVEVGIGKGFSIGLEASARLTFFDHLDDVSGAYVDPALLVAEYGPLSAALADRSAELEGGTLNRPGAFRGDPGDNDWFYIGSVTLSYRFGHVRNPFAKRDKFEKCYQF